MKSWSDPTKKEDYDFTFVPFSFRALLPFGTPVYAA
jgi:hypothetical protein